jgi:hypothetical protein
VCGPSEACCLDGHYQLEVSTTGAPQRNDVITGFPEDLGATQDPGFNWPRNPATEVKTLRNDLRFTALVTGSTLPCGPQGSLRGWFAGLLGRQLVDRSRSGRGACWGGDGHKQ